MSILRVACLGVALAAVWAYFAELASREVLISIFFASLIGALFLGSAKKGKSSKGSASEDESDDEDFKEIGLDIAKENIIPSGSRRSTKVCPTDPSPSNPLVSSSSPPRPLVHEPRVRFAIFPLRLAPATGGARLGRAPGGLRTPCFALVPRAHH